MEARPSNNLYDLPAEVGHAVWDLTQRVAVAMRAAYDCDGISTRQYNEPAGNQDVWHLHVSRASSMVGSICLTARRGGRAQVRPVEWWGLRSGEAA